MSPSHPDVSVIIPTYNRGDILMDSIQSVLDQTYDDFELIVVDDASSDDTRAVVEGVDDDRVKYLGHDKNKGAPVARNTGVSEAKGEFIAFQDSDDEWLSTKLEKQVDLFRETSSDVGVVYTGMLRVVYGEERYIPYSSVEQKTGDVRHSLARQNFVPTQVAAVRSACFDEVGMFDEDAWPLSDWELWIRISQGFRFDLVDEPLVTGKVRADSISTDHEAKVEARRHIVDKHTDFFDEATLSRQLFYIGHGYMKLGETRKGQTYLRRAVRTKPRPLPVAALVLSTLGAGAYTRVLQRYKQSPLGGATGAAEEDTPD